MPKVSVCLPDDRSREVRERNLPLSALTQDARSVRAGELTVADALLLDRLATWGYR